MERPNALKLLIDAAEGLLLFAELLSGLNASVKRNRVLDPIFWGLISQSAEGCAPRPTRRFQTETLHPISTRISFVVMCHKTPILNIELDSGGEIWMTQARKANAVAHQPSKAELEEDVSIDATPEALAWAVTRGGAERRDAQEIGEGKNRTIGEPR